MVSSSDEVKGGTVKDTYIFSANPDISNITFVMMVDEEYTDVNFDQEGENSMDVGPDDFGHVVFYRGIEGLGPFRPKSRRRRWTQRDMTNAYNAVKYQGMSLRGAATAFNVPESTLRDRVHGRVSLECNRPGPPTFFTFDEEKKMVDHILFMSKIGYPYTRNQVVELAGDMTKAVGRIAPFKYLNPSQAWFYAFLNRWPDLKNFLFGPRSNRKSKGVSGDAIQAYFEQLDKVLTKYDIKDKPEHMWVVDEVSVSCENQPPKLLPISVQRAQSVSYWSPTVVIIGAGSAAGEKIPPFLLYHGETITHSMMEGSVRGTKFASTPSGWVNSDAFIQWFLKHFRPQIAKRPLILLYDGHLQFISVRVLERAREDGVLLFPLPPHPAYNHCIENTCFHAFNSYFDKRLERFYQRFPNDPISKQNIAPILTHAYERALQARNMINLFARLGICPFNNLSTSIGAYLNIPDDCDQEDFILQQGENGEQEHIHMPSSSSGHWATANASINFNFQNVLSADLDYNRQISSQVSLPLISRHDPGQLKPITTVNPVVGPLGAPTVQTSSPCIRVISTNATTTPITKGKPLQLIPLPKQVTPTTAPGSHIAIRFPPVKENPASRPTRISQHPSQSNAATSSSGSALISTVPSLSSMNPLDDFPSQPKDVGQILSLSGEDGGGVIDDIKDATVAPGICAICGQLEPPGFDSEADDSEPPVVDWITCNYCKRWMHLNSECSRNAILTDSAFMCALCRAESESIMPSQDPVTQNVEVHEQPVVVLSATSTSTSGLDPQVSPKEELK
nr:kinase D interacting substrate of 220 kDa [Hymenolepis microstoma]